MPRITSSGGPKSPGSITIKQESLIHTSRSPVSSLDSSPRWCSGTADDKGGARPSVPSGFGRLPNCLLGCDAAILAAACLALSDQSIGSGFSSSLEVPGVPALITDGATEVDVPLDALVRATEERVGKTVVGANSRVVMTGSAVDGDFRSREA